MEIDVASRPECLGEHTLDALSRGQLTPTQQGRAAAHLDVCDECRRLLAALGRIDELSQAGDGSMRPRIGSTVRPRLVAGSQVGRYTVLHVVGAGAMGTVYAAYDPELDRRVALKLVHADLAEGPTQAAAAARLLREAQALARLSHPHVITVFDAGQADGRVFLAMEFVEGGTLRQWLARAHHEPAEIVAMFVAAGRGLAALHAAGLVHRDFKPDNVLVGGDGRVRVSDFGLVREGATVAATLSRTMAEGPVGDAMLTRTGALVGTPAYMAPEVWQGATADARSDQFGFCVALWEALQGERLSATTAVGAVASGAGPAPRSERIPAGLRAPLVIGLSRAPERRHASMAALLVALEHGAGSARRRRGYAAVALGLVGLAGGVFGWQRFEAQAHDQRVAACESAGASIEAVWGADTRTTVERAFIATGVVLASTAFARTAPWLDRWAADWARARSAACRAHTVDAIWDAELRERAEECLDEARAGFAALVDELRRVDAVAVTQATDAAASLAPADTCMQADALRERPTLPRAERGASQALRARMARARSLQAVGDYTAALTLAHEAIAAARGAGWPALLAEAEFRAASLYEKRGDFVAAEAGLLRALTAAEKAQARRLALAITTDLVYVVGYAAARHAEGRVWARAAQTLLALLPGASPLEQAHLDSRLAAVEDVVGAYAEAATLHARALAVREEVLGPTHPDVARSLVGLAAARQGLGELDVAAALYRRALVIQEQVLGADHPDVALIVHNLAGVRLSAGALAEAVGLYRRALDIQERAFGPNHPGVADTLHDLAVTYRARGADGEALRLQSRALAIQERALGPDHPRVASTLNSLAVLRLGLGERGEAERLYARAMTIYERRFGPDHPEVAAVLYNLALARREAGALAESEALLRRAHAIYVAAHGAGHPDTVSVELELAGSRGAGTLDVADDARGP